MNIRMGLCFTTLLVAGMPLKSELPVIAQTMPVHVNASRQPEEASSSSGAPSSASDSNTADADRSASAENAKTRNAGRQKTSAFVDRGWQFGGSLRVRVEDWNWWPTKAANGAYTFTGSQLRLSAARQTAKEDYFLELQQTSLINLPTRAIAPAPQGQLGHGASYFAANGDATDASIFLKQAYIRFKDFKTPGQSVRLGRFEFSDGAETMPTDPTLAWLKQNRISQRLIGPFGFTHVGRSFDGIHYVYNTPRINVTALGVLPTRGVFDLNGWDTLSDIRVAYLSATKPLPGKSPGELRLFYIYYEDARRGDVKTDNRPLGVRTADKGAIRIDTFGAHYIRTVPLGVGQLDALLWGAGQVGNWGSLQHGAFAGSAEIGYQLPKLGWKPWFRAGYYIGSGDGNSGNKRHGTFFPILYTARPYARYPFFNESNIEDLFVQAILKPTPKLTIRTDIRQLRLADSHDLWYSGGGAFQNATFGYQGRPSSGSSDLARLVDISADYQLYKSTLLTLYFAYANGGPVMNIYNSRDSVYGFAEVNFKF